MHSPRHSREPAPARFCVLLVHAFAFGLNALVTASAPGAAAGRASFTTGPEGPILGNIETFTAGATVAPAAGKDRFAIRFSPQRGSPAAILSFPEASLLDHHGLALDVTNHGSASVVVYADLNENTWMRGFVSVAPGQTGTLYVFARWKTSAKWPQIGANDAPGFPEMHGLPGGKMYLWSGLDASGAARSVRIFVVTPQDDITIEVGNLRPFGSAKMPDVASVLPFVDRYGQYQHAEWPGKVHTDADFAARRQREDEDLAAHPVAPERDQFGGWAGGPQLPATGHFRAEKFEGQWWLVDPEGRLLWSQGVGVVGFQLSSTTVAGREQFYADPAPDGEFLPRNLRTKYGADWSTVARDRIVQRLTSWGLNTLGGSSDMEIIRRRKIPYTLLLWTGRRPDPPIDPDSPAWAERMRRVLTEAAATANDDPWCLGFFVDNEIHVSTDPAWFERYYRQVATVAKEVLPHKLYLGSRLDFHDWPDVPEYRKEIARAAARYCDVISFNFYKYTVEDFALPDGIDRPVLIGEFHFGALDRGLFHTGLRGVISQDQRAEAYRYYVMSALRNPAIVGAHWFQCYDESITGRRDGENYQIGLLDICDEPYEETVAAVRKVADSLYAIRRGGSVGRDPHSGR